MECNRAANLIDAYMDGELDPLHALEVEAHLQECRRCAALLDSRKALQQAIRTKLPYYTAPVSVRRAVVTQPARKWKMATLAMAACLAVAVGGISWMAMNPHVGPPSDAVLAEAVETDHLRSLLVPDHLVDVVSSSMHTVKPWFAGKLPFTPPVPDLSASQFDLVGGRLDILNGQTVAALVYRHHQHVINVFVSPKPGASSASQPAEGPPAILASLTTPRGHHLVRWTCDGFECWAISDMEQKELEQFAYAFQRAD